MAPFRIAVLAALLVIGRYQSSGSIVELTLRDAITNKGVAGAQVILTLKYPTEPAGLSHTLHTDDSGRVSFKDLPEGPYVPTINGKGYLPVSLPDRIWATAGEKQELPIRLNPMAVVTGKILYPNGDPFPGAEVTLLSTVYNVDSPKVLRPLRLRDGASAYTLTDDRGEFRLSAIPPGEYYLQIDSAPNPRQSGPDNIPRFTYYPGVSESSAATPINLRGQDASLSEIKLPREKTFQITGTLSSAGVDPQSPVDDRLLTVLYFGSAGSNDARDVDTVWRTESGTASESTFTIAGVRPGEYVLYSAVLTNAAAFGHRSLVTVGDQDVEGLRVTLKRNAAVNARLRVVGDSSALRPESLRISLSFKERLPSVMQSLAAGVFTPNARTGEFVMPGLVEGVRYGIRVNSLPPDAYVADIRQGTRSPYRDGFFVAGETAGSLDIEIGTSGGTLRGVVRDVLNQPAANAEVTLIPDFAHRANSLLYKRATTNAEGKFTIRGIAPGEYQVLAWGTAPAVGAEEDSKFIEPYLGRGASVRISAGTGTEAQLRVLP